jgi:hypothetical protein
LAAILAMLLIIITLQLTRPDPGEAPRQAQADTPAIELDTSPLPRPDFPPLQGLTELRERPLFEPERRVPEPPAQQTRDLAREFRERWKLTGIIVAGQARFAMLEDQKNRGDSMQLSQGSELDGWTLQELDSGQAVFTRDEQRLLLELAK